MRRAASPRKRYVRQVHRSRPGRVGLLVLALVGIGVLVAARKVPRANALAKANACAAYLPTDGEAVTLNQWKRDPHTGVIGLKPVGRSEIAVESRSDAWVLSLPESRVMSEGLYLDRASGSLTMPGIVSVGSPRPVRGGCEWSARETFDKGAHTVKLGTVSLGLQDAPGRCSLSARFRKVIEGRPVVDEDFVAVYPCQAAAR